MLNRLSSFQNAAEGDFASMGFKAPPVTPSTSKSNPSPMARTSSVKPPTGHNALAPLSRAATARNELDAVRELDSEYLFNTTHHLEGGATASSSESRCTASVHAMLVFYSII